MDASDWKSKIKGKLSSEDGGPKDWDPTIVEKPPFRRGDQVAVDPAHTRGWRSGDPPIRLVGTVEAIESKRRDRGRGDSQPGDTYYEIHCDLVNIGFNKMRSGMNDDQVMDTYGRYRVEWPEEKELIHDIHEVKDTLELDLREKGSGSQSSSGSSSNASADGTEAAGSNSDSPSTEKDVETKDISITYLTPEGNWEKHTFEDVTHLDSMGMRGEHAYVIRGRNANTDEVEELRGVLRILSGDERHLQEGPLPRESNPPEGMSVEDPTGAQAHAWWDGNKRIDVGDPYN